MPSGLDILDGKVPVANAPKSNLVPFDVAVSDGTDPIALAQRIGDTRNVQSGLDLLNVSTPAPIPIAAKVALAPVNINAYDPLKTMESMIVSKKQPTITPEESSGAMQALNKVWGLAKNPYDVIKGTAELVASVPGFIEGVGAAAWNVSKALGQGADLSQVYDAASKGMQEMNESWKQAIVDPLGRLLDTPKTLAKAAVEKVTGVKDTSKEEDYSGVVGDIAMAPLNLIVKATHSIADAKWIDDYPNVRGAIKFGGDALGLLTLGRLYHGGSAELAKDIEPIIGKADEINKQQKIVDEIPNEILKRAQEKVLEVEKIQLELEAKRLQDKLDHEKIVAEDLKAKGQEVQDIKDGKAEPNENQLWAEEQSAAEKEAFALELKTVESLNELNALGYEEKDLVGVAEETKQVIISQGIKKQGVVTEDPVTESFLELSAKSDKVQLRIDAKHDELEQRGLTWEQQNADPELMSLYDERIKHDTAASLKAYDGAKKIITSELKGIPHESTYASIDSILNEHYSLTPNPNGVFMMSEYTGKALDNPKTVEGLAKDITKLLVEKDHPGLDFWTLMESPLSALTRAGKEAYIKQGIKKAKSIHTKIRDYFIKESSPIKTEADILKSPVEPVTSGLDVLEPKKKIKEVKVAEPTIVPDEVSTTGVDILEPKKAKVIVRKGGKKEKVKVVEQPQPITDLDLQTGTPLPKKLSSTEHPFRDKDKAHTETVSKMYINSIKSGEVDPEIFTRYLINETNRWLNGDEPSTPIEKIRNGLSNAATNAENARFKFDRTADFEAWRGTVTEAARWARGADRLPIKQTNGITLDMLGGQQLYDKVAKVVKRFHGTSEKFLPKILADGQIIPKTQRSIIEETIDELGIHPDKRDIIRKAIMGNEYFQIGGEAYLDRAIVFFTDRKSDAKEYAKWAGEAYDNALLAVQDAKELPDSVRQKALDLYNNNRKFRAVLLELEVPKGTERGEIDYDKPVKVTKHTILDEKGKPIKTGGGTQFNMMIPVDQLPQMVKDLLKNIKVGITGLESAIPNIYRNKEIFDATGFWKSKDGKWRYEIGDEGLKVSPKLLNRSTNGVLDTHPLSVVVEHPSLYEAVPELKTAAIRINRDLNSDGVYYPALRRIEVKRPDKDIIVHEVQHAVNDIMKSRFRGTSPEHQELNKYMNTLVEMKKVVKDPFLGIEIDKALNYVPETSKSKSSVLEQLTNKAEDIGQDEYKNVVDTIDKYFKESAFESYMKDPGEMEARLSEIRAKMTAEQRKAIPPWLTLENMLIDERLTEYTPTKDSSVGSTLYMGLDPTQISAATKKIIEGAKSLARYTEKARGMKDWNPKVAAQNIKEELVRSFVDRSGNIRKELLDKLGNDGYEVIQKMYLSKGASSLAAQQLKQMRKEVYDGYNKGDKKIFDDVALAVRMLDIGKYKTPSQFKFPEGLNPVESASYLELFRYKNINGVKDLTDAEAHNMYHIKDDGSVGGKVGAYYEWMKKPLKDMLDAELISQEEYDALASHNYRRLKLVDVFDRRYTSKLGKTKRTVYDSGVEALSHGRDTDVFEPSSEVMALEVFNRAYGRILNNAANKTLLDLARNQKDNPFVAIKDSSTDRVPSGWDRIFVYEKGERKAIYLSPEMSKEWITNSPEMSYKMSQTIRYASGSPVLRTFATGIDWDFALRNLPRDVMHIWYAARVFEEGKWKPLYNTASPVYAAQMGIDLAGVFHDAIMRKGKYQDYIKEGGGMEFLVHQGRLMQRGRHIEDNIDKVQNFLGYFGETSEVMTRLAIRDRVIKRRASEQGISYEEALNDKKITQEATFAARDYMDFSQGGGITKALDNGIPYLNASVVGTRGLLRAFKDNPAQSAAKLAQLAAVVTGLYIAANKFNPKTMQALQGDIVTQSNIVIPLGDNFSFQDEKGQTRYIYLKLLPLDPGQKFFKKFFEASTDKWLGNPVDVDGTINALSQLSPVGVSSLPPTVSGALGYLYNKNFWTGGEIWNKTDKPLGWPQSKEEYIPGKTPQAFQDLGSLTGLSPERAKYAVGQLFTSGTMWGQLVGAGYDAVFGGLSKDKKEMHIAEVLSKMPITKNFIGITNPYTQFATPINEAKEQSMMKRWIENRGLDQRVESFLYEGGKRSEVIDYIKTTAKNQDTQDRLKDRFVFQEKIKDLPNRSFWLSLKGIPDTEARAKVFVDRFDSAAPVEREQMNKEIGIVISAGGVISDEFKQKVMQVRDANARAKIVP